MPDASLQDKLLAIRLEAICDCTGVGPDAIKPIKLRIKIEGLAFVRSFEPNTINVLGLSY